MRELHARPAIAGLLPWPKAVRGFNQCAPACRNRLPTHAQIFHFIFFEKFFLINCLVNETVLS
jgi:hypothetical protein